MEKGRDLDRERSVLSVLTEGKEFANQLMKHLQSRDTCDSLVDNLLSSYDKALRLLHLIAPFENGKPPTTQISKKRKKMGKWSEEVRVCSTVGFEDHLEDGHQWRKYGQKDILGANHPRAYYRCTHRHTRGCLATKQVQRTDDDPSMYMIVYKGKHSCIRENVIFPIPKKEEEIPITIPKTETLEITPLADCFPDYCFSNSESYLGIGHSLQSSESEFGEIISDPSSINNIQLEDLDFCLEEVNFDSNLLEALNYYE